ncbi:hypothetical protein shim_25040 [Shimia sp. SK013]|nr:hypothetical protein shim_25040 [Shimia sp. SK013]
MEVFWMSERRLGNGPVDRFLDANRQSPIWENNKGQRLTLGGSECALPWGGSGAARAGPVG